MNGQTIDLGSCGVGLVCAATVITVLVGVLVVETWRAVARRTGKTNR